jgi:hypothetical protein
MDVKETIVRADGAAERKILDDCARGLQRSKHRRIAALAGATRGGPKASRKQEHG